jgi:prevent-host-death family protein
MEDSTSITATEFKAKCLEILDRVSRGELKRVTVTKRGKAVAVVSRPSTEAERVRNLHGFMRGTVVTHENVDLTRPIVNEPFTAEQGKLHR